MKKQTIVIGATALVILLGIGVTLAYHANKTVLSSESIATTQPQATTQSVAEDQSIIPSTPAVQPTTEIPVAPSAAKASKPKTVSVTSTANVTVMPQPVTQTAPQPVVTPTPVATPVQAPVAQPTSMYNVLSFASSTDHKKSDTFTIKGNSIRIDYSCGHTDRTIDETLFNATLRSTDGNASNNFADTLTDCPTDNAGRHTVLLKNVVPGEYYLDVGYNMNITYEMTVWDIH